MTHPIEARPRRMRARGAIAALALGLAASAASAQTPAPQPQQGEPAAPARSAFKVCADPNSMPLSNDKGEGYENKIAAVFAKDLGLPLTYFYFPNRMNFIRNTLRFKLPTEDYPCDIVMGVPAGFDQVSATKPYYRTTYVLLYPKGKALEGVHSSDDLLALPRAKLAALHIGLYDRSPASQWLARHQLVDIGVPYQMMNADPSAGPGQDVERDLLSGKIDGAIVWGPIAGYLVKRHRDVAMVMAPMKSEAEAPMEYSFAMGVRYGEPEWKKQVEDLIARHRDDIRAILVDYGVPLVAEKPEGGKAEAGK